MRFVDFVAINLNNTPDASSIDHKSMASFISAVRGNEDLPTADQLAIWVTTMIERQYTAASRRRYIGKLNSIYSAYCAECDSDYDPFTAIKSLRDCEIASTIEKIKRQTAALEKIIGPLLQDARTRPELAVLLYMLFNATSDIGQTIFLTTSDYAATLEQLNVIIDTSTFHHRRKYVFDLAQPRKRMPQLIKETTAAIQIYLLSKGIDIASPLNPQTIVAWWITKARDAGISLPDIKATADTLPPEFVYLDKITASQLTPRQKNAIKQRVADSLAPMREKWYAIKLRRNTSFDDINKLLAAPAVEFYYPTHETARRVGKKIERETVPVIPDIVFFKTMPHIVASIDRLLKHDSLGWVYRSTTSPDSPYSTINGQSMRAFQIAVGSFSADVKVELSTRPAIGIGRQVRITGGVLQGYQGTIYDIQDNANGSERIFYIRLSQQNYLKIEASVEEIYIEPLDSSQAS